MNTGFTEPGLVRRQGLVMQQGLLRVQELARQPVLLRVRGLAKQQGLLRVQVLRWRLVLQWQGFLKGPPSAHRHPLWSLQVWVSLWQALP